MATFSYGILNPSSSVAVRQVGENYSYQYQSNGYNTANWNYTEIINASQISSLPAPGSRSGGYTLYTIKPTIMDAGLASVEYTWVYQPTVVPPTAYSMQGAVEEQSIVLNSNFASKMAATWDYTKGEFTPDSPYYGRTAYKAPVISVYVKSYSTSEPSQDLSSSPLGKLQVPGGGFSGDYTHWLVTNVEFSLQGNLWITDMSYLYNGDGYNTDIYDEA